MTMQQTPVLHLSGMGLILLAVLGVFLVMALGKVLFHCRVGSPVRSVFLAVLVIFSLALVGGKLHWVRGRSLPPYAAATWAAPPARSTENARELETDASSWEIEGRWEKSYEDAEQNALAQAYTKVIAYLGRMDPPLEWTPSTAYVHTHLVKSSREETKVFEEPVGTMRRVRLEVAVTSKDREVLVQQDRRYRVEQRMLLVGKLLAGLVAVLAAVAGYIRLDESTKGYYTARLKLAVVLFLALGFGLLRILGH